MASSKGRDPIKRAISNQAYELRKKGYIVPENYAERIKLKTVKAAVSRGESSASAARKALMKISLNLQPKKGRNPISRAITNVASDLRRSLGGRVIDFKPGYQKNVNRENIIARVKAGVSLTQAVRMELLSDRSILDESKIKSFRPSTKHKVSIHDFYKGDLSKIGQFSTSADKWNKGVEKLKNEFIKRGLKPPTSVYEIDDNMIEHPEAILNMTRKSTPLKYIKAKNDVFKKNYIGALKKRDESGWGLPKEVVDAIEKKINKLNIYELYDFAQNSTLINDVFAYMAHIELKRILRKLNIKYELDGTENEREKKKILAFGRKVDEAISFMEGMG